MATLLLLQECSLFGILTTTKPKKKKHETHTTSKSMQKNRTEKNSKTKMSRKTLQTKENCFDLNDKSESFVGCWCLGVCVLLVWWLWWWCICCAVLPAWVYFISQSLVNADRLTDNVCICIFYLFSFFSVFFFLKSSSQICFYCVLLIRSLPDWLAVNVVDFN